MSCKQSFSSKRRPSRLQKVIFEDYFYHRHTLHELSIKYHRSREWIQTQIHSYQPTKNIVTPKEVTLVLDATFFGKRKDKFGVLVAKETDSNEIVDYRFIESETLQEYKTLISKIREKGFTIQAVSIDGRRGLFRLFTDIPVQMCHFHQQAILTRYLTRKPKPQASIDLKRVASYLGRTSACRFQYLLDAWYKRHHSFLNEKVEEDSKRGWRYKHKRLRSAYRSLRTNFDYLFSYKNHPELNIPNTTNALDGGCFAPMKMLLKIHRGIGIEMKKKLIVDFLEKQSN